MHVPVAQVRELIAWDSIVVCTSIFEIRSLDIAHCIFVSAPRISSNWDDMTFSLMSREQPALGILVFGVGIELETMAICIGRACRLTCSQSLGRGFGTLSPAAARSQAVIVTGQVVLKELVHVDVVIVSIILHTLHRLANASAVITNICGRATEALSKLAKPNRVVVEALTVAVAIVP